PWLGHLGMAAALLASGVFLGLAVSLAIRAKGVPMPMTTADLKVGAAAVAMGLILWQLHGAPILALVAASAGYAVVLHLARFVTGEERLSFRSSLAMRQEN
ncbi:MAG: hypothetical protein ACE5NC_09445, partial [Anaerolineae bacterium]